MKIKFFLFLLISICFAGCTSKNKIKQNSDRAGASTSSPSVIFPLPTPNKSSVERINVWRIDGFGRSVFTPANDFFKYHSKMMTDNLISVAWVPLNKNNQNLYFSTGLVKLKPEQITSFVKNYADLSFGRESLRCLGRYERRTLLDEGSVRFAEVTNCRLKEMPVFHETAVHLYVLDRDILYMAHWVEKMRINESTHILDSKWEKILDSMNPVIMCEQFSEKDFIPVDCALKISRMNKSK